MKLTCQCCGIEQEFKDAEEAFDQGWDAPPHFFYTACNLCPGVCVVLGRLHTKAHAYWSEHGRPEEFNEFCVTDDEFGDRKKFDDAILGGRKIVQEVIKKNVN